MTDGSDKKPTSKYHFCKLVYIKVCKHRRFRFYETMFILHPYSSHHFPSVPPWMIPEGQLLVLRVFDVHHGDPIIRQLHGNSNHNFSVNQELK